MPAVTTKRIALYGTNPKTMCIHIGKFLRCIPEHQLLEQQHCTGYPQKQQTMHAFLYSAPNEKVRFYDHSEIYVLSVFKKEICVLHRYHDATMILKVPPSDSPVIPILEGSTSSLALR
jgi:hypothetical protein